MQQISTVISFPCQMRHLTLRPVRWDLGLLRPASYRLRHAL